MLNTNNFKVVWWAILVIAMGAYLYLRQNELLEGKPTYFDVVVFLIWISVCLAPLFKEVKIFGLHFKQEFENLKKDLSHQLSLMKVELQSSIDVSASNTSHVHINSGAPIPASDSQIPNIKQQVLEALQEVNITGAEAEISDFDFTSKAPNANVDLFKVRLSFESIINDYLRLNGTDPRRMSIHRALRELMKKEVISPNIGHGVLEVIAICNYAVHGEKITDNQVSFVNESAGGLYKALKWELENHA